MSNPRSDPQSNNASSTRSRLLASAAALALLASGAAGEFVLGNVPAARAAAVNTADLATQSAPSFAPLIARVKPAVVSIKVQLESENVTFNGRTEPFENLPPQARKFFKEFGDENGLPRLRPEPIIGQGSGFFVSSDGYIVTNNHVVDHAKTATVTMSDGKIVSAKVIGTDPKTDLALLKVDHPGDYPYVAFAKTKPRVGDWVVAIGNPYGLGGTATAGIVSAEGRDIGAGPYEHFMQIDAPINKGNSGGPTFNADGHVVGVNTMIISPSGGSVGIGFDIPADTVQYVVNALEHGGVVRRGYLGVMVQPVTQDMAEGLGLDKVGGAIIDKTEPGTPAAGAGLATGDVIVKLDGQAVASAGDLTRRIGEMKPGTQVELAYWRDGAEKTVTLTLAGQPGAKIAMAENAEGAAHEWLGLQLAPAGEVTGAGGKGVAITGVDPDGRAAAKGVKEGDVILSVSGKSVSTPAEVHDEIDSAKKEGRKAVLFQIKTAAGERFVAFAFPSA
ncbi:Do family serine endopeptidase [Rhodoblastus acidophilus]|uniref:Probable periplasmic serine endoprotease DegP-like n=1 Tax=Candidatus Rhodoblastus alkanivorans TaxID=2954117 RepID=A0ABS9Z2C0_9HYPH|nr:Do family serine endopeptidase [Candidatus Rhodoblastus alkanivorans]MCI4677461.1 Do family serine endopeptidase [Candidatus Rhodoblastus alkanivorans]MCI4681820.1 Do family serine endopeptidase [Candidatus Rhodoblastus alkanivorans]MDI4642870.1 Do family serine endopeptidase [Rhodoblastus acidophilus]